MRIRFQNGLLSEPETPEQNIYEFSPYLKENTALHHYKYQLDKVVYGNNRSLNCEPYKTHTCKLQRYRLLR